ncbi:MAG: chloride channel protein [Bacteroidetes bacterium CG23_combo_of_CG06-09_8_20_14_all_32_9]|nr:MAG: chloride channel protein [Bacteroidetes bacterium CG23_combo_of_CG06-09_8_20_14_all_32_9]
MIKISTNLQNLINRLLIWRLHNVSDKYFIIFLSVTIGILAGLATVIIKNTVHFISYLLTSDFLAEFKSFLFLVYPMFGMLMIIILLRFIIRKKARAEIPNVLFAISKLDGKMSPSNIYTTIIASTLTVGFGGSVGLEGPSVTTSASVGSTLAQLLRLNYKQTVLLIGCASAAAIASLFKAPVTGIVFALEIFMLDLTMASILPLLISSTTGALASYLFYGQDVLYNFQLISKFHISEIPYYLILGLLTGLFAAYFTNVQIQIRKLFKKMGYWYLRLIIGGIILGILIFFMPSLFGEGYVTVNSCLHGDYTYLFEHSQFYAYKDNIYSVLLMFLAIVIFKSIATAVTFGAGGAGGIFAPVLFLGANTGFLFAKFFELSGIRLPASNYALVGMAGLLSGVMYAPLTGIFLIAEITNGYELIFPLLIVSTMSYAINRSFNPYSIYTRKLAQSGNLITHNKDKTVLSMMKVEKFIETNFRSISPDDSLRKLTEIISKSNRNLYPVIDNENNFLGIVFLDHIKHIIFKPEFYDTIFVRDLSFVPSVLVSPDDTMEEVVKKFQDTGNFNLPVVKDGKYLGFVSRANIFSAYRKKLKYFSEE